MCHMENFYYQLPLRVELDQMGRNCKIPIGYQEDILDSKDILEQIVDSLSLKILKQRLNRHLLESL